MNITQEFRQYISNRKDIEQYHMNIYQSIVSNTIDNRMIQYAREQDMDDLSFKAMIHEYRTRISNQCMITTDWREHYTKIMVKAYNGVMRKYGE